jgi:predicted HicB family RNase H-like nuclease
MRMSLLADGIGDDLRELVELGGEAAAEAAERISSVLVKSTVSRVLSLLSEAAAEVSAQLPEGEVQLRLAGDDCSFAFVNDPPPAVSGDAELTARITLRLSDSLKQRIEENAAREGQSVNSWILRQLERRTSGQFGRWGRSQLHGYGTS